MASEVVEIEGHIIDSLILAKVMDVILAAGADYRVLDVEIGKSNVDTSRARIEVIADNEDALASLLVELQVHRVRAGDLVVVGNDGVRVEAPERPRGATPFEFMTSEVSSEKPKGLLVYDVARRIRRAKAAGGRVLAVCGPAVIHTGAGPEVA